MKPAILSFVLVLFACGRIDLAAPSTPSDAPATTTATSTSTGTATAAAAAAAPAPAATPTVVVNNTVNNTQNAAPAAATTAPTVPVHPGLIAKGDSKDVVQAVLGAPTRLDSCGMDATGWWYDVAYCVGFASGGVVYQYNVPAAKLYLPSW